MGYLTKIQSVLGLKGEKPPQYGEAPYHWNSWGLYPWIINREVGRIDYRTEVGKLDDSSLVMAVVNWTGTQLPEAPPVVQKPGKDNALEVDWGNEAADILRRPNKHYVWADYCGAIALSWWIDGNVYFYKVRDATGKVVELWYLPHFLVEPRWPGDGRSPEALRGDPFISSYQYNTPGKQPVLYPAEDVIHLRRFIDPCDPRRGLGAFNAVVREIYGDNAVASFSATLMRNMGMVPYLLAPKEQGVSIGETDAEAIKANWLAKTQGQNIGHPLVNTIPLEVTKLGLDPKELDLSALRMVPESRIAAVTGIPAAMLQFMVGLENGTSFAAYREARQQGYESVIIPIQTAIAEQLTWQLLPELDKTKGARYAFDTGQVRVLQEDRDALYKRAVLALQAGGISRNQFAMSLGKPTPDKEEIYYVPSTSKPMTQELIEETAAEKPEPPPVAPPVDPEALKKFADIDRWFDGLEKEMKEFVQK